MTAFNEDSRVNMPALLHLARPGYRYPSLNREHRTAHNHIFRDSRDWLPLLMNDQMPVA